MKHLFIVNPAAGKGKTTEQIPDIKRICESNGFEYEIVTTDHPGHATEIAAAYNDAVPLRIYSVGGDGTLNEVLNGMAGSKNSLAAIPCGSGNDFIRSIVGPDIPENITEATIKGTEESIDYMKVNNSYCINISSLGFDAEVVYQTRHFKKLPFISGEFAYVLGILAAVIACKNHHMEIKVDGTTMSSAKSLLVAVGNGRFYGGGMLALPKAKADDGLLEVCHVDKTSRLKILNLFPRFMKGLHGTLKEVHFYSGKKVEIIVDKPVPMNIDGELLLTDRACFEIISKGLSFVFPKLS